MESDPAVIVTLLGNGGILAVLVFLYAKISGLSDQLTDLRARLERVENVYFREYTKGSIRLR